MSIVPMLLFTFTSVCLFTEYVTLYWDCHHSMRCLSSTVSCFTLQRSTLRVTVLRVGRYCKGKKHYMVMQRFFVAGVKK